VHGVIYSVSKSTGKARRLLARSHPPPASLPSEHSPGFFHTVSSRLAVIAAVLYKRWTLFINHESLQVMHFLLTTTELNGVTGIDPRHIHDSWREVWHFMPFVALSSQYALNICTSLATPDSLCLYLRIIYNLYILYLLWCFLLHFWLDAKLHFVALYLYICNDNKVESNLITTVDINPQECNN